MSNKITYYGKELYHYGVKGQQWGKRQYQNEDGSLTQEGRIHYGYGIGDAIKSGLNKLSNLTKSNTLSKNINKSTSVVVKNKTSVSSPAKTISYTKNDPDFADKNYSENNRVGNTDFFMVSKPNGSRVLLEEDMKWNVPSNISNEQLAKALKDFNTLASQKREEWTSKDWEKYAEMAINGQLDLSKELESTKKVSSGSNGKEIEQMAKDVINGKYGNGQDRKKALGNKYSEVQSMVNQILSK